MKALDIGRRHTPNVFIKEKKTIQATPASTVPLSSVQSVNRVPGSREVPGIRASLGLADPYHILIGVCRCLVCYLRNPSGQSCVREQKAPQRPQLRLFDTVQNTEAREAAEKSPGANVMSVCSLSVP